MAIASTKKKVRRPKPRPLWAARVQGEEKIHEFPSKLRMMDCFAGQIGVIFEAESRRGERFTYEVRKDQFAVLAEHIPLYLRKESR